MNGQISAHNIFVLLIGDTFILKLEAKGFCSHMQCSSHLFKRGKPILLRAAFKYESNLGAHAVIVHRAQ